MTDEINRKLLIPTFHLSFQLSFFYDCGNAATSVSGGTSSVTTEPAAVTEPLPTLTGATTLCLNRSARRLR